MEFNFLIVEDDFIIRMYLEKLVVKIGCKVIGKANTGEKAVPLAEKISPDIILMDIGLAGKLDGIETAEIINKKLKTPIVFITGNSDPLTLKRAINANPVHIFKKPIIEDVFKRKLMEILNQFKMDPAPA